MTSCYIGSKFENKIPVRELQKLLRDAGFHITYDWTVHEETEKNLSEAAWKDLEGVFECDVFALIWHPDMKGGLVEFGAALGGHKKIVVIDCPINSQPNIFFHLKKSENVNILFVENIQQAFESIINWKSNG